MNPRSPREVLLRANGLPKPAPGQTTQDAAYFGPGRNPHAWCVVEFDPSGKVVNAGVYSEARPTCDLRNVQLQGPVGYGFNYEEARAEVERQLAMPQYAWIRKAMVAR